MSFLLMQGLLLPRLFFPAFFLTYACLTVLPPVMAGIVGGNREAFLIPNPPKGSSGVGQTRREWWGKNGPGFDWDGLVLALGVSAARRRFWQSASLATVEISLRIAAGDTGGPAGCWPAGWLGSQ